MGGWMGGWMDGWMGGWVGGCKSRFKDCLQQSKIIENKILIGASLLHLISD
jgi:hypothetical protein